jgi:hypothetical protein
VVALGRTQEEQYLDRRYDADIAPPLTGGFRATPQWTPIQKWALAQRDKRIGISGRATAFGQYFFYGGDLSEPNYVQYIGEELRRGTFRPINVCRQWRQEINEGNYDYVVTTPRVGESEERDPPENVWTTLDDNIELVLRSGPARIYEVNGELDPKTCDRLGDEAHT